MQLKFNMLQSLRNDNGEVENGGGRRYKLKRSTLFFIRIFYKNKNVQPKICQNIKNMLRTYIPEAQRRTIYFPLLLLPKSRKSALHNVLHGIRVQVKFCSFKPYLLSMVNNTFPLYSYISLI